MNDENFGDSGRAHEPAPVYNDPLADVPFREMKLAFEIDIDAVGKNARALQGIFIVNGKPLVTTYEIRDFTRKLSKGRKRITVKVVD